MLAAKEETTPIGGAVSLSAETRVWGLPPGNRNGAGGCWPVTSTLHWGWSQFYAGTASGQLDQRYYNAGMGRFWSPDPTAGNAANPGSMNKYAYGSDDPINNWDPSGMDDCPAGQVCIFSNPPSPANINITQLCLAMLGGQWYQWQFTNPDAAGYPSAQMACQMANVQLNAIPSVGMSENTDTSNTALPKEVCNQDVIKAMTTAWSRTQNGQSRS